MTWNINKEKPIDGIFLSCLCACEFAMNEYSVIDEVMDK